MLGLRRRGQLVVNLESGLLDMWVYVLNNAVRGT